MSKETKGATIAELLVSVAIFSIALVGVFLIFRKSYQSYHFLEKRQSLQVEMLKLKALLKADFQLSHFRSIGVAKKTGTFQGRDVRRDDVSCLILDDWKADSNYDSNTLAPRWNQYAAYRTRENETTLIRQVSQNGSRFPVEPLLNLDKYGLVQSQLLSENLIKLKGTINEDTRDLLLEVRLGRSVGSRGVDEKRTFEKYDGIFRFTPQNTQPKL